MIEIEGYRHNEDNPDYFKTHYRDYINKVIEIAERLDNKLLDFKYIKIDNQDKPTLIYDKIKINDGTYLVDNLYFPFGPYEYKLLSADGNLDYRILNINEFIEHIYNVIIKSEASAFFRLASMDGYDQITVKTEKTILRVYRGIVDCKNVIGVDFLMGKNIHD